MIKPKEHLKDVYRPSPDKLDRSEFIRLDKNEQVPLIDADILDNTLREITPDFLSTYPMTYKLYEKISEVLDITEDHLLITAGSDAAIRAVFDTFVEKDDEVLMINPTFAMYEVYCELYQAKCVKVDYESELFFPLERFIDTISEKTKLVVIANPNSPTGTIIAEQDLIRIVEKAKSMNSIVIIDEAYYYYCPDTMIDHIDQYDNLVLTRTFSKAFGLASVRLGFAVAHPNTIQMLSKFKPMYEVNSFAVLLGCTLLNNMEIVTQNVQETNAGKEYLISEMSKLGFSTMTTHANFLLIQVGENNVNSLSQYLNDHGLIVKGQFSHNSLKEYIRISLSNVENMRVVAELITIFFQMDKNN